MAKNGTMKKAAKRKATSNPITHHKKRRRNPGGLADAIGSPKQIVEAGLAGLASAVATRQLPQLLLGANNTSWQGYAANAVTAVLSTWAAGAFIGATAARAAFVGGLVIVALVIWRTLISDGP